MSSFITSRVLPEGMKPELRAEQQLRGQRAGVDFYMGEIEIIGTTSTSLQQPPAHALRPPFLVRPEALLRTGATSRNVTRIGLCYKRYVRPKRKHGWQDSLVGAWRLEKGRAMLDAVKKLPWEWALVSIANGLAAPVQSNLVRNERPATAPLADA